EVKKMEVETQLEKAKASEKAALKALENCTLKAPYDGVVDEVFVEKGVELGVGAPVVRLLNVAGVEVHFPVPENEIADVEVGGFVRIEVPAVGKAFEDRVSVKGVTASPFAHTYDCTVIPSGSVSGIMPGMVCKVWLRDSRGSSLVVPMTAVSTDMRGRYVWTVSPAGTVKKNYVIIGGYSGDGVAVTEGLAEGDVVVVEGARKVSTGMKVKTIER
ncbi:MAG: efflux RND transporter periplasmic adaptor subunit, partial [Candidatus Cryptobacteroides sp.]